MIDMIYFFNWLMNKNLSNRREVAIT